MRQFARYKNGRISTGYERTAIEQLIERLTNWQRKQWCRAGRPMDADSLRRFGRLQRDGSELWVGEVVAPHQHEAGVGE